MKKIGKLLPWAEGPFEFVAWIDIEKTLALIRSLQIGHELKCHVEYFYPLVGMVPKYEEEEGKKDE